MPHPGAPFPGEVRQIKRSHKWVCLGDVVSEQDVVTLWGPCVWRGPRGESSRRTALSDLHLVAWNLSRSAAQNTHTQPSIHAQSSQKPKIKLRQQNGFTLKTNESFFCLFKCLQIKRTLPNKLLQSAFLKLDSRTHHPWIVGMLAPFDEDVFFCNTLHKQGPTPKAIHESLMTLVEVAAQEGVDVLCGEI